MLFASATMPSFVPPTPVPLTHQRTNRCRTRALPRLTLTENPATPAPGKRVPTFKKLQRKHHRGPASFRRAQTEQEQPQHEASEYKEKKKQRKITGRPGTPLRELVVGQSLSGIVQNIVPHGAFVDVGATRDGLVHVRDMAIDFVHTPHDVVRSGMHVHVWVKYVDPVRDVLGLTMVRPILGFEGRNKISEVEVGTRYHGVVERITNYGAYIDIGAERLAFLHVSGVWGKSPRETLEYMRLLDRVWVSVLSVDEQKGHIRLSARGKDDERLTEHGEMDEVIGKGTSEQTSEQISPEMAVARPWEEQQQQIDDEQTENENKADNDDEGDDEWDDFDFVDEDAEGMARLGDHDEVAHMFTGDTEFVDVVIDK